MVGLDCASGLCDADNAVDMLIRPLADRDVLTGQEAFFAKTKAELVAALKDSFAYMDRAFALGDAAVAAPVKLFGMDTNKFAVVGLAIGHTWEHYGNMVTYMRIKGIVPPSSEPRPASPAPAPTGEKK